MKGVKGGRKLQEAVPRIVGLAVRPAGAIVVGDCAFLEGDTADYSLFGALIDPLRQAGIPIHLMLGNHDDREHLLARFPDARSLPTGGASVAHKNVGIWETPHANWFLLDSLYQTNVTPGLLGEAQLAWLAKALDARPDKPAIVLAHHNVDLLLRFRGLRDGEALLKVVMPRKQVKAYFCGHMHWWKLDGQRGLHLVTLPPIAWLSDPSQPRVRHRETATGWREAQAAYARSNRPQTGTDDRVEVAGMSGGRRVGQA